MHDYEIIARLNAQDALIAKLVEAVHLIAQATPSESDEDYGSYLVDEISHLLPRNS